MCAACLACRETVPLLVYMSVWPPEVYAYQCLDSAVAVCAYTMYAQHLAPRPVLEPCCIVLHSVSTPLFTTS